MSKKRRVPRWEVEAWGLIVVALGLVILAWEFFRMPGLEPGYYLIPALIIVGGLLFIRSWRPDLND